MVINKEDINYITDDIVREIKHTLQDKVYKIILFGSYARGDYKGAANRAYYSIFHSMRSILALDGVDFSKHSAVSAYFRKEYIKTGIFDTGLSDIISSEFATRSDSDYDDYYELTPEEIMEQIENSQIFYDSVKRYLDSK